MSTDLHKVSGVCRFSVEIQGIVVGGFSEVSGLTAETEIEQYAEGGLTSYIHRFPKNTRYSNLVLKRGITYSDDLLNWYKECISGKIVRRNGAIILYDRAGEVLRSWGFVDAYPVKWVGAVLNAGSSNVAFESLELVHNGFSLNR